MKRKSNDVFGPVCVVTEKFGQRLSLASEDQARVRLSLVDVTPKRSIHHRIYLEETEVKKLHDELTDWLEDVKS